MVQAALACGQDWVEGRANRLSALAVFALGLKLGRLT
jgi:hypothetical protein